MLSARQWRVRGLTAWCSVAGVLAATWLVAQAPGAEPVVLATRSVRVFTDADGLPQNTVHSIALDRHGYLWVGTQDGAAFYDGRRWRPVDMPGRTRSNFVRCILPVPDGSLWFGTQYGGLYRRQEEAWSTENLAFPGGDSVRANAFLATSGSRGELVLWVATHTLGLARRDGSGWTIFDTRSGLPHSRVWGLLETRDAEGATLWVGTQGGLASLRPGASQFTAEPALSGDSVNSFCETRTNRDGPTLWVGTYGGGVARRVKGTWARLTSRDGLPSDFVTSLIPDRLDGDGGAVWVGTDGGGVARVEGSTIEKLSTVDGLPSDAVYTLAQTRAAEGARALWVGTRNGGLARVMEGQWRSLRPIPGRSALPVTGFVESRDGSAAAEFWVATDGGGLARAQDGRWTIFDQHTGALPNNSVLCVLGGHRASGERSLWAGTRNGGLVRFDGRRWTLFDRKSGALGNDLVQALLESVDERGQPLLWVGTRGGLSRLAGGRWSTLTTADGLPHDSVLSLVETRWLGGSRVLWVGTAGGLARLEGGRWRRYDAAAGLANTTIQALHVSRGANGEPELWVGTDGGGLYRLTEGPEGERWLALTDRSTPALPNNVVYQVVEDGAGRLYVLTNRGVARLTRPSGGDGGDRDWQVHTYTVEDGLPLNQCNRGAALLDGKGRVWVGTVGGAGVLDPFQEIPDRESKPLVVRAAAMDGTGRQGPLVDQQVLSWDARRVRFEFDLLSYFREGDTRYRTQLVGLDREPTEWTSLQVRELGRVPAGDYTFRVWGRDYAGNIAAPAVLRFTIRPAPWVAWWAWLTYAAFLVLGVLGVLHLRARAHRHREKMLRALMEARTRELLQANELLVELSYLDPLTGIGNRRRFEERLVAEWKRAVRAKSYLSVVMIDIDHFKAFNDAYGHQQGDACLKAVATAIVDGLPRAGDSVARYGGEEFVVVLPLTDRGGAVRVAESLRQRVERLGIVHESSSAGRVVTISCGVATFIPAIDIEVNELIRLADEALYRAKQGGRNQTRADHGPPRSSSSWPAIAMPPEA